MVEHQLRERGIRDPRVLDAMERIPRERFVPPELERVAYRDRALSIGLGQTISQPYMVAGMTEALHLTGSERVLEIGTGSGYQTAILAALARHVYTVERVAELSERARGILAALGLENISFRIGDGSLGWPEEAPFDAILVTAGAPEPPPSLLAQLEKHGGRLVIPVGGQGLQELLRIEPNGAGFTRTRLMGCRFVPLIGKEGWPESAV